MLGLVAFVTWRSTHAFMTTADWIAQTQLTIEAQERVKHLLTETESAQRGFMIEGSNRHLAAYAQANVALRQSLAVLTTMTTADPEQAPRIRLLGFLIKHLLVRQQAQIEARQNGDASVASVAVNDQELLSSIRKSYELLSAFEKETRDLVSQRSSFTRLIGQATTLVVVVGMVFTLLAVLVAGRLILRDISARRRAEEALADQHNLLSSILDTMPDHVFVKDVKGRYILDNRAHRQYLGIPESGGIEGKTVFDFFPRELAELYDADDQRVLETGKSLRNREERARPEGSVAWLATTKVPLRETDGRILGLVCVSSDITERKDGEEKLRRFAEQLERSNSELQNFASVASHDLQEPLRKIQAFGDRLKAKCSDGLGELGLDYLGRMQNAAQRMQILIQDLLKLSRVTSRAQPFERCDLAAIAQAVISDLEVAIEQSGGKIEVGKLPTIDADPLQMRQLFQNLISNGLKFRVPNTPPCVQISGAAIPADDGDDLCQLVFTDNGIGFEEKFAEQIFVVFQRLHGRTEFEGTGIGLAVCRKITDRHGGSIVAKSTEGHGAKFIVTLPVKQRANPLDE